MGARTDGRNAALKGPGETAGSAVGRGLCSYRPARWCKYIQSSPIRLVIGAKYWGALYVLTLYNHWTVTRYNDLCPLHFPQFPPGAFHAASVRLFCLSDRETQIAPNMSLATFPALNNAKDRRDSSAAVARFWFVPSGVRGLFPSAPDRSANGRTRIPTTT